MTTDRPYRKALSHEEARHELMKAKGSQLDPQLVEAFVLMLTTCETGTLSLKETMDKTGWQTEHLLSPV